MQIRHLGWGTKFDEWVSKSSPRLQPLNSRSHGAKGSVSAEPFVADQELIVNDDADDPPTAVLCQRKYSKVSVYLAELAASTLTSQRVESILGRLKREPPYPVSVRHHYRLVVVIEGVSEWWLPLFCYRLQEVVQIVRMFGCLYRWLSRPFLTKHLPTLVTNVSAFFNKMDDEQLRSLTKEHVVEVLRHMRALLRRLYSPAETGKAVEV